MIIVSTATFPVDQIREVVINRWAKEVVNNPAPDYMTVRGPYSMTDPDKGLVVMSIIELDDAKLAEAILWLGKSMVPYWDIPGFNYSITPWSEPEDGLKIMGMDDPRPQ